MVVPNNVDGDSCLLSVYHENVTSSDRQVRITEVRVKSEPTEPKSKIAEWFREAEHVVLIATGLIFTVLLCLELLTMKASELRSNMERDGREKPRMVSSTATTTGRGDIQ
jgi:hypothetical protein